MHEIRATLPPHAVTEAVRLAHAAGIPRVNITDVFVHGPQAHRQIVSIETSTPKARAFVEAFFASPTLSSTDYSLTSRELRAVVDGSDLAEVTHPMSEPFPDVRQDLWQMSYVTASYVARAVGGGILLATGIIDNDAIAIVVAALFLPFLAEVLAVSFGARAGDLRLVLRGGRALATSTIVACMGGALVAWFTGGPIRFEGFKGPLASCALSVIIGITAGLSDADDTGRRYLIGVAAAVQLAIFPTWFGAALVIGLPARDVLYERILSFVINVSTIAAAAFVCYAALPYRAAPFRVSRH